MKNKDKKWPTDNEIHHRWGEKCKGKYVGVRECPACRGTNTGIDEPIIRIPKPKTNL